MADLTSPNYPTSYEDDSSLFAPLVDRATGTVKASIAVDALQVTLEEDFTGLQGDPCFLVFEGGEIWNIEDADISFSNGDTIITLSSLDQRGYGNSPIQPHSTNESAHFTIIAHHQVSYKEAVEIVQKNGFLVGDSTARAAYESGAEPGEGWLETDTDKVYYCFTAGTFTWVNIISHNDLTGLGDDDHTQYHTDARADTWHSGEPGSHIEGGEDHDHYSTNQGAAVLRVHGGTEASRPGSPSIIGDVYFSTDTAEGGTLFISDDGSEWVKISGAPTGAIMMFDGACPSGWTRYTALDEGVYPRVDSSDVGTTGGASTHNHGYSLNREHYHEVESVAATNVSSPGNHSHIIPNESGGGSESHLADVDPGSSGGDQTNSTGAHSHTLSLSALTARSDAAIADDGGTFTDETGPSNESTANDMTLLPASPAVNDAYYFGHRQKFSTMLLDISTAGAGTWTITWEYWDGTGWSVLSGVTDDTSGFTVSGQNTVSWTEPGDWALTEVNNQGDFYFVRARVSAFTSITTQPKGKQVFIYEGDEDPVTSSDNSEPPFREIVFCQKD